MNQTPGDGRKVQALRDMPQDLLPERDLWAGIESGLASRQAASRPTRRAWVMPASLAASVMLAAIGVWMVGHMSDADQPLVEAGNAALVRTVLRTDPDYQREREALLRALPEKLKRLPPESRQRVQESLQSIQQAMATIEEELGRDAGNTLLQELLISTSQEEMRVLVAVGSADGLNVRT